MIDIRELRIGNRIFDSLRKKEIVVTGIISVRGQQFIYFETIGNAHLDSQDCEPIQLDEFVLDSYGFLKPGGYYVYASHRSPYWINYEKYKGWFIRKDNAYINSKPIVNIHDLQNVYFDLAGIELVQEIK